MNDAAGRPVAPEPTGESVHIQRLTALLQLEKEARQAASETELAYVAVNETHRVVRYQQAVMWRYTPGGRIHVEAVSGVAKQDRNAPYMVWVRDLIQHLARQESARGILALRRQDVPGEFHEGWDEWCPEHMLWCPLISPDNDMVGGLLLTSAEPFGQGQETIMQRICETYAHALVSIEARQQSTLRKRMASLLPGRRIQLLIIAVVIALMFLPVRLSVLAPATVIAESPVIVSAPVEGAVSSIAVKPNQAVKKGDLLFTLDDTALVSEREVAEKALQVARAEYLRAAQKAFRDADSKAELATLEALVQEKQADLDYATAMLERIKVRAEVDGIAVFTDPNDWLGKPVVVGEKVMMLARPELTELEAWVPVADAIRMEVDAPVKLFLNVDPTRALDARLYQISYEAEPTPDNVLAFRVKARFEGGQRPRVGLKGTAKIYGDEVSLFYYLARRPLAAARQFLGL